MPNGKSIRLNLSPNPSHLEAVDGVVEGISRARINTVYDSKAGKVLPILVHGDAAIAGQGVVYEVVQMETLDGYKTGGTIHVVINNQVGFTTNYLDARSSTYCTDIAKVVLAPVLHVNGDDVESVIHAVLFAAEYRQRYNRNVFIDLLCYRKYGHNEGDEPRFTQPLLYKAIAKHPNPRTLYAEKLKQEGVVGPNIVKELESEFKATLQDRYDESKEIDRNVVTPFLEEQHQHLRPAKSVDLEQSPDSSFDEKKLQFIADGLTTLPEGKVLQQDPTTAQGPKKDGRRDGCIGLGNGRAHGLRLDLLLDGFNADEWRGLRTGNLQPRHAVIKVEDSEEEFMLLNGMQEDQGRMAIYNSHLSEYGVMAFDYGYAMASPDTLTIWEAQFGDFVNGAQIIIDQFLSAAEDKWRIQNGLVLFLPHGYEGQGAEHSSARLERFLQLCAQDNMQVVNATTPANFFHLLRRQMHRSFRKPLVVMTPKSLLRHPRCVSPLKDLSEGRFCEILDDPMADPQEVRKLVFCSGKLYYELLAKREELKTNDVALIRIEQLYPFPERQFRNILARYPKANKTVWSQEEPANMGARAHILLTVRDVDWLEVSAPESASPASGSHQAALAIQKSLINETFEI